MPAQTKLRAAILHDLPQEDILHISFGLLCETIMQIAARSCAGEPNAENVIPGWYAKSVA